MAGAWEKGARAKRSRLTPKQRMLLDAYYGAANFNKTRALAMAGYSQPHNQHRNFNHPAVVAEMERRERETRERYEVSYDRVRDEIAKIAFSNILNYGEVDKKTGTIYFDFNKATASELAAIGEVTVIETENEKGEVVRRIKVKPFDKLAALRDLMTHAGLSKSKEGEALANIAGRLAAGMNRIGKNQETSDA